MTEHIHMCPRLVCAGKSIWHLPACPFLTVRGDELGHGWPHHDKSHSSEC